jgi:hypothetical protein
MPRVKGKDMLCYLPFSAAAAEGGSNKGDSGNKKNNVKAICSHFQLESQQALRLPELLMKLKDVCPWGSLNQLGVWRAFG